MAQAEGKTTITINPCSIQMARGNQPVWKERMGKWQY